MQSSVDNSRNIKQENGANLKRKIDKDESTTSPPQKMQRQDIINLLKQGDESPASNLVKSRAPGGKHLPSNDKLETAPRDDTRNSNVAEQNSKQTVNSDSKMIKSKSISSKNKEKDTSAEIQKNKNMEKDTSAEVQKNKNKGKDTSVEVQKNKSAKSKKECTQCGKSSEHISTIIKQVSDLEKKLTIDMSKKEEKFKMEKEAWKVREKELEEALSQKDDSPSKELSEIKLVLEKNKEELDLAILEKDEQANKIVTMQALNDDLDIKYYEVKKELENLKKLKNVDKDLKEKAKQNEDTIAVQAKSISTLELEISQKGEQINSLKSDLETKEKQILNTEFVLLELKEKEDMLKLAVERENTLKEKIEQIENELQEKNEETEKMLNEKVEATEKEIQSKDQIICDFESKAIESEHTINNLQNEIIKKQDSVTNILEEKEQWENKYIKSQEFANNLKQENEEQKAQNDYLVKWKETETEKLRSSLKLRLSTMIEKNVAKDKLYQQKIQSLENLLNEKAAQ